jgi:ABC-type transport system involved in multi-copper enzyme maturation permease subunit
VIFGRVYAIAANTFREAIRNKILYSLVFFAVVMILSSAILGQLSLHEEVKLIKDFGLTCLSGFGVLIAIFIGVNLVYKELELRTIFVIMPKPIRRYEFILGKYAGIAGTLLVLVVVMAAFLYLLLSLYDEPFDATLGKAILLIYMEILVMTAVAVFFSSFSTPFLSGFFTLGVFVLGRLAFDLRDLTAKVQNVVLDYLIIAMSRILPNLEDFNIAGRVVHKAYVSWSYVGFAVGYGLAYVAIVLFLATILFNRRDFL